MSYSALVARKLSTVPPTGLPEVPPLPDSLFPHQKALTAWAIKRGRCAIFADTGLGKTRIQVEWADAVQKYTDGAVLILAPLAVAAQTVKEGAAVGVNVNLCRAPGDLKHGINITNYDRLHKFNPASFTGIVLDESSCIKHHDTQTLAHLLTAFRNTPFKLCASATPAPNDWTELGTHAEFLGICSRVEMLSEYFCHDGAETQVWRLKGHAQGAFWRWVSTWGAMVRKPSDLGYDDSAYALPPLKVHEHIIASDHAEANAAGMLFQFEAATLSERRSARRASMTHRVAECAALVNADKKHWVVWCDLNAESDALTAAIDGAVEIRGSQDADTKEQILLDFAAGKIRVLVSKPSITGFGLNWQHCSRMAFVGVTDSFESYYQAVRRCWRFGQKKPVNVHLFVSELEGAVLANLKRKEADAKAMGDMLSAETLAAVKDSVLGLTRETNPYDPALRIAAPAWLQTEGA